MNNKKFISLTLGIMCLILTFGIAIQVKTTNSLGTTVGTNATENELRSAVLKSKEKYDNLYNELEEAEKQLEAERTNVTQNNGELENLENSIKEANKSLGLTDVTGTGVIIEDPNDLLVHDIDLIRLVNELKNAGAEAISVNDQRIVTNTSIECEGSVIKVNGVKIGAPFEIKAIGLPELLSNTDRVGGYLWKMREDWALKAKLKKFDNITIPKYTGVIKYEYAESK